MNREEEKILRYTDLKDVPVQPIAEPMVPIPSDSGIQTRQIDARMLPVTGEKIYVRQSVVDRLLQAAALLAPLALEIVYGYRTVEIQRQLFEKFKAEIEDKYQGLELICEVHKYIASPDVAGHPTGGAVDVQIVKEGEPLDFGTKIWEFVPDAVTFSPRVSKEAWQNRQLLRTVMLNAGFAPFDGEWWHFSYGDKEWAKYYGKECALYEPILNLKNCTKSNRSS